MRRCRDAAGGGDHEDPGDPGRSVLHTGAVPPAPARRRTARRSGPPRPDGRARARTCSGAAQVARTLREKIPFTLSVAVLTLLAGVATTSLWRPLRGQSLLDAVAYGLPAFSEGRWWTPATGVLFAQTPLQYVPTLGSFVLLCGFAEYRMGTRRAAGTAVVTQLAGVLGAAAFLAIVSGHGWLWADQTALARDVGFSAGALGRRAPRPPPCPLPGADGRGSCWSTYVVMSFVYVGVLWDLEHLLAVAAGLALGPRLVGSRVGRRAGLARPRLTRREYRLLAAGSFVVSGLAALIAPLAQAGGPLATGMPDTEAVFASGPVFAVLWLLVAAGLRRGRRRAWRVAVFVTAWSLVALLVLAVVLAVRSEPGWPVLTYMLAFTLTQLAILVAGRAGLRQPLAPPRSAGPGLPARRPDRGRARTGAGPPGDAGQPQPARVDDDLAREPVVPAGRGLGRAGLRGVPRARRRGARPLRPRGGDTGASRPVSCAASPTGWRRPGWCPACSPSPPRRPRSPRTSPGRCSRWPRRR